MPHQKAGLKLSRTSSHRTAMFRNMVTSLFKYDRIRTTDAKAKEIRRWADQMITLAKRGDLHARRQVLSVIREKDVVQRLFEEAGERFKDTTSGYTRIVKLGSRPGDAAPVSVVELVAPVSEDKKKGKKKQAKSTEKKKTKQTKRKKTDPQKQKAAAIEPEAASEKADSVPTPDVEKA